MRLTAPGRQSYAFSPCKPCVFFEKSVRAYGAISEGRRCEGLDELPIAQLQGPELDVRLLVDHRERLIRQRTALINDLRWQLHDLWPEFEIPPRAPAGIRWRTSRRAPGARRADHTGEDRPRDELRRIRELSRAINALAHDLGTLVAQLAPRLLAERGRAAFLVAPARACIASCSGGA